MSTIVAGGGMNSEDSVRFNSIFGNNSNEAHYIEDCTWNQMSD